MSQKPDPKKQSSKAEGIDDLELDPETVADLEPRERSADGVRGGRPPAITSNCQSVCPDCP